MNMKDLMAMLFGVTLGDGWIDIHHSGGISGDVEGLTAILEDLQDMFDTYDDSKIVTRETYSPKYSINGTTSYITLHKDIVNEFLKLSMPVGKRVEQEWILPDWIVNGSYETKRDFMSGFYAAEGTKPILTKLSGSRKDTYFKPLNFCQTKRIELQDNLRYVMNEQFASILDDLGIEYNIKYQYTHTCADNIRIRFDFKNNIKNTMHTVEILDMRYCPRKQRLFDACYAYYDDTRIKKLYPKPILNFKEYCAANGFNIA